MLLRRLTPTPTAQSESRGEPGLNAWPRSLSHPRMAPARAVEGAFCKRRIRRLLSDYSRGPPRVHRRSSPPVGTHLVDAGSVARSGTVPPPRVGSQYAALGPTRLVNFGRLPLRTVVYSHVGDAACSLFFPEAKCADANVPVDDPSPPSRNCCITPSKPTTQRCRRPPSSRRTTATSTRPAHYGPR